MPQRSDRIGVPQRGEPLPRRLGSEARIAGIEARHCLQERAVEQLLVDAPHLARVPAPLLGELGHRVRAESQRAADATQRDLVLGHDVRPPQLVQLDPVLEGAQEAVRRTEGRAVLASHVPPRRERLQRDERRRAAQHHVAAAVHELQELHRELHVAQSTAAELELAIRLARGDVILDALPHALHVGDEVRAIGRGPHEGQDGVDIGLAQRSVAGRRPGLEQGLELPGLGPALVVAHMRGEGAHERSLLALRPQRGVHLPQGSLGGRLPAHAHDAGREALGGAQGCLLVASLDGLGDEDHVDVAHVVELATSALAHRDHRQAARRSIGGQLRACDGESSLERGIRKVSELLRDVVDACPVHEIAHDRRQQFVAIGHPQGIRRAGRDTGRGCRSIRVRTHGGEEPSPSLRRRGCAHGYAAEPVDRHRMTHEMVGEGIGHAHGGDEGGEPFLVGSHRADVCPGGVESMQRPQGLIRIRRGSEGVGECLRFRQFHLREQPSGLAGIGESTASEGARHAGRPLLAHRRSLRGGMPVPRGSGGSGRSPRH